MKYKKYRICLLSLVLIAVIGGIFYYATHEKEEAQEVDGIFVERLIDGEEWMQGHFAECANKLADTGKRLCAEVSLTGRGSR